MLSVNNPVQVPWINKSDYRIFQSCNSSAPSALSRLKYVFEIAGDLKLAKYGKMGSIAMACYAFAMPILCGLIEQVWSFSNNRPRFLTDEPAQSFMDVLTAPEMFSQGGKAIISLLGIALLVAGGAMHYQYKAEKKIKAYEMACKGSAEFILKYGERLDLQLVEKIKILSSQQIANDMHPEHQVTLEELLDAQKELRKAIAFFKIPEDKRALLFAHFGYPTVELEF